MSTAIVKAGLNLNNEGFLFPINEHPWHIQCTQSYCLMVQIPLHRRLIIPRVELARFYFGSSSGLIYRLFLPALFRDALFSSALLDPYSRRLLIDLADKMSGVSAADIGWIAMDPYRCAGSAKCWKLLSQSIYCRLANYPQARFPMAECPSRPSSFTTCDPAHTRSHSARSSTPPKVRSRAQNSPIRPEVKQ